MVSPDMFPPYSETLMKRCRHAWISIRGHNINNLGYANLTMLTLTNENDLQALIDRIVDESEIMGLSLNNKKTELIIAAKKNNEHTAIFSRVRKMSRLQLRKQ
jgi:hypothetical protein